MTFVIGLESCDGIVMCSDSLEDDGITKKTVDKIRQITMNGGGIAITGAGPGAVLDKFCDEISASLYQADYDRGLIETTVEDVLAGFWSQYVATLGRFQVIVGVHGVTDRRLYRSTEIVLSRVIGDCHTGTGNDLCRLITDNLYSKRNCVEDNLRLAIFTTKLATKYASGVEGPIQAISHTFGERFWTNYSPSEIRQIESELSLDSLTATMRKYWRLHNPPTRSEQARKYKGVRTPGDELTILEGVKLEELYTVSGRRRASKIFRRNTDKLQQRALLEAKRYREAHPSASQSGDDKIRT